MNLKLQPMSSNFLQRISIPKPCHEDWSKMTPDQKGAFCGVCNKSVHDFSKKNAEEIERILLAEEEGKVCGRFSSAQLELPRDVEIPLHLLPRNLSPFRAFALAVFLVFGSAMFGISDVYGQDSSARLKGKVCIRKTESDTLKKDVKQPMLKGDVALEKVQEPVPEPIKMIAGGIKYTPPEKIKTPDVELKETTKGELSLKKKETSRPDTVRPVSVVTEIKPQLTNTTEHGVIENVPPQTDEIRVVIETGPEIPVPTQNPETFMTGQTVVKTPEFTDPGYVWGDTSVSTDSVAILVWPSAEQTYVLGGLGLSAVRDSEAAPPNPIVQETSHLSDLTADINTNGTMKTDSEQAAKPGKEALAELDGANVGLTCFPNPTKGLCTLGYTITHRADVHAEVYDARGKMVRQLFKISNHYEGVYQNGIDLSDLADGTYLILLFKGDLRSSTRVIVSK